jgi:hypothetical protein
MTYRVKLLWIFVSAALIICFICKKSIEHLSLYQIGSTDSTCASHCVKGSNGKVMEVYDCCDCKATTNGVAPYEPSFYMCMCEAGYGDYCYKPWNNLLLSQ